MFDRPQANGNLAILVHIDFSHHDAGEDRAEFIDLVHSTDCQVAEIITTTRDRPDAKYFIGSGKVEEIAGLVKVTNADVVIFNHSLSPAQERNLEKVFETRVLDRTGLILDIFAQRARTHEGKLQVELAQLQYMATKLVRGWTHLERQKGGIGLRGPGETQLETDRRLLRERVKYLRKRLDKVRSQRQQSRQGRQRRPIPVVSLVGYTNAGKSTLFNALTHSDVYVADQLFATLDPTLRRISLNEVGDVVLVDTVGFIRHLPHDLVDAFRATLEETREADLLLHVIDVSNENYLQTMTEVESVLAEIGAAEVPALYVYNKIDLTDAILPHIDYGNHHLPRAVYISAQQGLGLDQLRTALKQYLGQHYIEEEILLMPEQGRLRARLYAENAIISEHITEEGGYRLHIKIAAVLYQQLFPDN